MTLREPLRFTLKESKIYLDRAQDRIGRLKQRVDEIRAVDGKLQ